MKHQKRKFNKPKSRNKDVRMPEKQKNPVELERKIIIDNLNLHPSWIDKCKVNPIKKLIKQGSPNTVIQTLFHLYDLRFPHSLYRLIEKPVFTHLKMKQLLNEEMYQLPKVDAGTESKDVLFFEYLKVLYQIVFRGGTKHLKGVGGFIIEFMKFQNKDGRFPLYYHHHAHALRLLMELGMGDNRHVDRGLQWVLKRQRDDGGWLHRANVPKGENYSKLQSCIWTTAEIALVISMKKGYRKSDELKKACEFLLKNQELDNKSTLLPERDSWNKFSSAADPVMMFAGGTLKVLKILANAGYNPSNPQFKKMYTWMIEQQLENGYYPMAVSKMPIESEWVTVQALSVIKQIESSR